MKIYYVYTLASKFNGTLYIGCTSNLLQSMLQHKADCVMGFTNKYKIHNLVYYECYEDAYEAVWRERKLKTWLRQWKVDLINKLNPIWRDLYKDLSE
jgi:putative endonuclease